MNLVKPERSVTQLAANGKHPVKVAFHSDGTISFRDAEGHWTDNLVALPARLIGKLDRRTRARLWYRNFQIERAWAEAHA